MYKIGNLVIEKNVNSKEKKILLMAHMDEIGFHVIRIKENGRLFLRKIGGVPDEIVQSRFVDVVTDGGIIKGVIGSVPPLEEQRGVHFLDRGVPMIALSVAVKYLHSSVEMVHINDLENLEKLLIAILEEGI